MNEEWKNIQGYNGLYQISNYGNIRVFRNWVCKPLSKRVQNSGYYLVHLSLKGNRKAETIHRLVAIHFLDRIDECNQVDHIDGNKLNNHVSNLRWVDSYTNMQSASKNGLLKSHSERGKRVMKELGSKYGFDNSQKHLIKAKPVTLKIEGETIKFRSTRAASMFLGIDHKKLRKLMEAGMYV